MSTEKLSRGGKSVAGFALGASPSYEDAMSSVATSLEQTDQYGETTSVALTDAQLSAPLGSLDFGACGAPDDMKLTVQVAVKGGRAVGVTVETDPSNKAVASCIDRAIRKLRWPSSPKLDSFTTRY